MESVTPSKDVIPTSRNVPRVVAEYFEESNDIRKHTHYDELFNAQKDNVDLQTQLSEHELRAIATLQTNDKYLAMKKVKPVYDNYIHSFMRLKISLDRQSRKEYVEVNKAEQQQQNALDKLNGLMGNNGFKR
jgi:hypothetical protein